MAVNEYVIAAGLQSRGRGHVKEIGEKSLPFRSWVGAPAKCGIYEPELLEGNVAVVSAESLSEAVRGLRELYPTLNPGKVLAVLKSSMTEE